MSNYICKRYSEIDQNLYEIVDGPFYNCEGCGGDCDNIPVFTNWKNTYVENCLCINNPKSCFQPSSIDYYSNEIIYPPQNKTKPINIPCNPYIYPNSTPTSPVESGKLLISNSNYTAPRLSNKIKITIPYDPIFKGIYVFDNVNGDFDENTIGNWVFNSGESSTSINQCYTPGDINQNYKYLISFTEVNDPSDINQCYTETYIKYNYNGLGDASGDIYAFPAKYYMCITNPAININDTGSRLSVGFTLPIRYRSKCGDWIVVDRLYNKYNQKTPHVLYGNSNYAYYETPTNGADFLRRYKFLTSDNQSICGSGLNEIGFSFKCEGSRLGYNCVNICNYPYTSTQDSLNPIDEISWFTPKIPVMSTLEFVYDCRPLCYCPNFASYIDTNWILSSGYSSNGISCYGSSINMNIDCNLTAPIEFSSPFTEINVILYLITSSNYKFFIKKSSGDIFWHDYVEYSTPLTSNAKVYADLISGNTSPHKIIQWINSNVVAYSIANNRYSSVDLYWYDIYNNQTEYYVYIVPSEDN